MKKVDYKKQLKQFYSAQTDLPVIITLPPMNYLMIDGRGDPNTSPDYQAAIEALYAVAYTIKFMCKKELEHDFGVMPLEGLWWTEDMRDFTPRDKSNWLWTAMIMQPPIVTHAMYERAVALVVAKKNPSAISKLRFTTYAEGRAAQILYIGPYSNEGLTIQSIHEFIADQGGKLTETTKHHHEIYLSDARRADPEKLKTIIRQPF